MKEHVRWYSMTGILLLLATGVASAGTLTIVDTFGPDGSFETGLGQAFGVRGTLPVLSSSPAVQFVPGISVELSTISVAVGKGLIGSTFGFDINLMTDNGGKPGTVLESWGGLTPNYVYTAGGAPVTVTGTLDLWLTADTPYWLQVAPASPGNRFGLGGTLDQWNYNDQGIQFNATFGGPLGLVALRTAPAFEIIGNTPEPASFALTGAALLGLVALTRKLRG